MSMMAKSRDPATEKKCNLRLWRYVEVFHGQLWYLLNARSAFAAIQGQQILCQSVLYF